MVTEEHLDQLVAASEELFPADEDMLYRMRLTGDRSEVVPLARVRVLFMLNVAYKMGQSAKNV